MSFETAKEDENSRLGNILCGQCQWTGLIGVEVKWENPSGEENAMVCVCVSVADVKGTVRHPWINMATASDRSRTAAQMKDEKKDGSEKENIW